MNDNEVNKIIAEFMELRVLSFFNDEGIFQYEKPPMRAVYENNLYTKSLDALVPVWEKLKGFDRIIIDIKNYINGFWFEELSDWDSDSMCFTHNMKTIQQAAAHATAKVILGLINESK